MVLTTTIVMDVVPKRPFYTLIENLDGKATKKQINILVCIRRAATTFVVVITGDQGAYEGGF